MIVVDTNVIGYLYVASEHSAHAVQALARDPVWAAPLLWRSELRSVLALCLRKTILDLPTALEIMEEASRLMEDREYQVASSHVLRLAKSSGCSAYDCEFVALAEELGVPLVTADKQVLRQFPDIAMPLSAFAEGGRKA